MIYAAHDIKRIAGEHIVKEFMANPNLTFTNTSYGAHGEVVGSLSGSDCKNHIETTILYVVEQLHWDSIEVTLKRVETVKKYQIIENGVEVRPYSNEETEDVILTIYALDGRYGQEIYTDNKEYAEKANAVKLARLNKRYERNAELEKEANKKIEVKPFTAMYDSFEKFIEKKEGKKIKYGSQILASVNRFAREKYDYDAHKNVKKNYIELVIHYTYRNKTYAAHKTCVSF